MEEKLPKRIFKAGCEPQVSQINNSCRMSLISKIKDVLPSEYNEVKRNPTFKHILGMYENSLGYSARLIHSIMCRQLVTEKKYELWFVFGGRPLRFSLQEFHAVTGLKSVDDGICDIEKWKDDLGFWSKLLKRKGKISIKKLMDEYIGGVNKWSHVDRIRLVYICVIAGFIMAKDEKTNIPHTYIQLVMDFDKLQTYPWGVESFNLLVKSIIKTRDSLKNPKSYVLDGFSFAFQIWIMEAIPEIGKLLGKKINEELTEGPRCSNWKGAAKVSYDDIILVENSFGLCDVVHPYICYSGNKEIFEAAVFSWPDEMRDDKITNLDSLIRSEYDFGDHTWEFVEHDEIILNSVEDEINEVGNETIEDEDDAPNKNDEHTPISGLRRCKKKLSDQGAEKRKKNLLCKRAASNQGFTEEDIKVFIQNFFEDSFSRFESKVDERLGKLEDEVSQIKNYIVGMTKNEGPSIDSQPSNTSDRSKSKSKIGEGLAKLESEVSEPKDPIAEPTNKIGPSTNEEASNISSGHKKSKVVQTDGVISNTYVDNVILTPSSDTSPSSDAYLQTCGTEEFKKKILDSIPTTLVTDTVKTDKKRKKTKDYPLVFVSEDSWENLRQWGLRHKELQIGPSVLNNKLLHRVIGQKGWLENKEIDAMMYLFRENTNLRRWKAERVGFMNCLFGVQIKNEFHKFQKNGRSHKWENFILAYGYGELPSHGKTSKRWATDLDRIYVPLNVNQNHWISMCINFLQRTIEVFDCSGNNNRRNVEPFTILIPRIVKAIHTPAAAKHLHVSPYSIRNVKVEQGLNKSSCDCGVYAIKYIECHLLGMDFSLLDDENIQEARLKIAVDLWNAANDNVLIDRMSKYECTQFDSDVVDID